MKKLTILLAFLIIPFFGLFSQNFYDINTIETNFEESNWDQILDQFVSNGEEERLMGSVSVNGQVYDNFDAFNKINMFDNVSHEDGQAGDGIYDVPITTGSTDIQDYIYAENSNAVSFSPIRAEYEFYKTDTSNNLVINEFLADNENAIADQDGEYDDWVELYNNGTESINLEGYYLSDDLDEPTQWIFPDTSIAGGGYLIVWADKDEEQQGLHANFKLSSSGETIIFSDNSLVLLDEVTYLEQKADTTSGRFPNGIGDFTEMLPTFGSENINTFYGINKYNASDEIGFILEQNHPNPIKNNTSITFKLYKSGDVTLNILSSQGRVLQTLSSGHLPKGDYNYTWNAQGLVSGLYFYSLSLEGQTMVKKMMVQ